MALDPRKREKKLARKKAKQKAKNNKSQRMVGTATDMLARLQNCPDAPVLHAVATQSIWENGMGMVLISRMLPNGDVAFANFLVDVYCLGVKNAMYGVASRSRYDFRIYGDVVSGQSLRKLQPAAARKLVEGAVRYAADLGFTPHSDYAKAKRIFGEIDAAECTEVFEYGAEDGKPRFIAGPYDSPYRCQEILRTLHNRLGPDGFHFIMPAKLGAEFDDLELIEDSREV